MEYIHEYVPACLDLSPIMLCLCLNDRLLTGWARGFVHAFVPLSLSPWKLHQRKETARPPSLQGQEGKSRVLHHPAGARSWIRASATPHSQKATELKGKYIRLAIPSQRRRLPRIHRRGYQQESVTSEGFSWICSICSDHHRQKLTLA